MAGQAGVWQAGSVIEVYSAAESRWLVAFVTQVNKGQMSVWVADERGTLGPKALSFSGLQIAMLGSNVTALPVGFQMVPSKSRPGEVAYLDTTQKRKYQTRELAWRCHIERTADLTTGMLSTQTCKSQAPAARSASRDVYASPPDDEPPASLPAPRLPVERRAEAWQAPAAVKREPVEPRPQEGLCAASSLPRGPAEPPPAPPRPRAAEAGAREAAVQPAPQFVGAQAYAPPAAPRCGGDKCGAFCPLRLKRLACRGEEDGVNRWARRQRARREAAAAAAAAAAAPPPAELVPLAPASQPPQPPPRQPAQPEDTAPGPHGISKAAEQYADQVAAALERTAGMPSSQRTPLFHFPALVAMGFPPAQARRALESTGGDLARAVEYCVSGGQVPPARPARPVVIEASQPATQVSSTQVQAPALPFAGLSPRRGRLEDSLPWPDTAEDRLRAAQEAAAFAEELHEEAVMAAISECERLHEEELPASAPAGASEAFEEALQAAWARYREEAPEPAANQPPAAEVVPDSLPSTPFPTSQTQPEVRGGRRASAATARGAAGRLRSAAAATAVEGKGKLEEEPGPSVEFFDGPAGLPLEATQPEEQLPPPRGGRRASGGSMRHRAGRARPLPAASEPESSLKEEEASVKEEDGEGEADLFGEEGVPGVAEATQALRRGSSETGSQLESLLAAAIDVPDEMDMDGLPATCASGGKDDSFDPIAASPALRAPWDEASQVPAGDNALSQPCASPLLPWGCASLPAGETDTQVSFVGTAWEPSARF